MSQIVLDEHLGRTEVLKPLWKWITAAKIENLAPDETLKDDRSCPVNSRTVFPACCVNCCVCQNSKPKLLVWEKWHA